jgi:hypothetical protein
MYPGKVEFCDLDKDGDQELILFSLAGMHYTNISVLDYKNNNPDGEKFVELFYDGSACPVTFEVKDDIPIISVGMANWGAKVITEDGDEHDWCYASEPLWQVYVWNGKEFIYDKNLSNTSEISEAEEFKKLAKQIEKIREKLSNE